MEKISFRPALWNDCEELADLVNSAYRGESSKAGWTTEADLLGGQRTDAAALREIVSREGNVILLAFRDEELVGCVFLQKKSDRAYLGMLTVKPTLQTGGLGKMILATAEYWVLNNWNLLTVEMTVIQKRAELISWYERRGYSNSGKTEPFPYGDPRFGLPKVPDLEFVVLEKKLV